MPVGQAILAINVVVFGVAAVYYGFEEAAVALIVSFMVARAEVARLKRRVGDADPEAFVTIISPQEVIGAGLGATGT